MGNRVNPDAPGDHVARALHFFSTPFSSSPKLNKK